MSEDRVREHMQKMEKQSREHEAENKAAKHPKQIHPRPGSVLAQLQEKTAWQSNHYKENK